MEAISSRLLITLKLFTAEFCRTKKVETMWCFRNYILFFRKPAVLKLLTITKWQRVIGVKLADTKLWLGSH